MRLIFSWEDIPKRRIVDSPLEAQAAHPWRPFPKILKTTEKLFFDAPDNLRSTHQERVYSRKERNMFIIFSHSILCGSSLSQINLACQCFRRSV
jgi:hypothetical protein